MKLFGGLLLATASAQLNVVDWLKAKYQAKQLSGVNTQGTLNLDAAAQADVLLNINDHSPQMGMDPLSLLMTNKATGISKDNILSNMKQNLKNQLYSQFQSMPINPAVLQYAKGAGGANTGKLDKERLLYSQFPDPMGTILRMKKSSNAAVVARADTLMKKMVARNMLSDDPVLPDLFIDNDKQKIKDYLFAKQLEKADPYMKTMLYRKFNSGASTSGGGAPTTDNKDLIKSQIMAKQFGDSLNEVTPNDAYLMFKFLQSASIANKDTAGNARVPANIILDVALGTDVAGIKANEFSQKFGVTATEFVCAAHEEAIRVPCMVNQETVTPGECAAQGCCYNTLKADGSARTTGAVPICYHNLLGKIGSGMARHMINDDNIKKLFGGEMPLLQDLTEAQTWAESQMPEVLRRLTKDQGSFYGMPQGQESWWKNMYDGKNFNIYATPAPATREFEWKPHGPTAMPGADRLQIPEVGGFLNGDNSASNPVNDLDFIIGNHVNKIRGELNSNSYTCRLIPKENMVNCYDNNYDALSTATDPAAECQAKGCCFREVNLFEKDNLPVCYRSLRSGYCDVPANDRGSGKLTGSLKARDTWWLNNPYREECGAQGISRGECLLNPQCCYDTNPRREGEAHCYKRGGVESLFNQKTGDMADQCDLTAVPLREACFDTTSTMGNLLNKISTEDQCLTAGCCFSQSAADAGAALGVLGTMNMAGPHCFKRPTLLDNKDIVNNYDQISKVGISDLLKVCAADPKWPSLEKRVWKESGGRWTLSNQSEKRPLSRMPCTSNGAPITDRHSCIYTHGCCFEKSSNPINPWCYKARLVKK